MPFIKRRPIASAGQAEPVNPVPVEDESKREWLALWDADWQHVAATGEHLMTVTWSDDGAVGVRGWYY